MLCCFSVLFRNYWLLFFFSSSRNYLMKRYCLETSSWGIQILPHGNAQKANSSFKLKSTKLICQLKSIERLSTWEDFLRKETERKKRELIITIFGNAQYTMTVTNRRTWWRKPACRKQFLLSFRHYTNLSCNDK